MRSRLSVTWFPLLLLAFASLLINPAAAHDAGTFTVIVKPNEHSPGSAELIVNDSVFFYNVDNRTDITHRIVYDADGDGLYNGTDDWDSGNLSSECALDEDGNKTDEDCEVTFTVEFNSTEMAGIYVYQDLLSDGTLINGTVTVQLDGHSEDVHPADTNGHDPEPEPEPETQTGSNEGFSQGDWLLLVAAAALIGALLLLFGGAPTVMDGNEPDDEEE
jgi:hypothetical protein